MAVILVLTSCGILGGAVFWAGNNLDSKARSLHFHLEEAHRLGMPTTLAELQVHIKDPAEDALPDLEKVYALLTAIPTEERAELQMLSRKGMRGRASKTDRQLLYNVIENHPKLFAALKSASQKTACSVPEVETWRHRRLSQFWTTIREGIRLLNAKGVALGQDHDLKGSEAVFRESVNLASHFVAQPSYLQMARRSSAEIELQRCIERVVYANQEKPVEMASFIERFQELFGAMPSAADMMRGEPPLMLEALSDPKRTGLENVPAGDFFAQVGKSGALEIWNRYFRKLPEDPEDLNGAETVLIAMDTEARDTDFYGRYVDGYDGVIPALRDQLARRRLASAAAKYLKTGALDDLPEDPHSAKPLLTKQTARSVILYSVGRDGVDHNAKEREFGPKASPTYDLLFRLPLVKPASQTNGRS
ncbi:MAG: hypothetical protein ACAH95_10645 [Fimbriimonas sp.]